MKQSNIKTIRAAQGISLHSSCLPLGVSDHKRKSRLKKYARSNKNRDVKAEKYFRYVLIQNRIACQRQKIIGSFIVDFFFPENNLVLEIDEAHHDKQTGYDAARQAKIEKAGFTVIRFKDSEVYDDPWKCVETLLELGIPQQAPTLYA